MIEARARRVNPDGPAVATTEQIQLDRLDQLAAGRVIWQLVGVLDT
jgi:hypothetical protein